MFVIDWYVIGIRDYLAGAHLQLVSPTVFGNEAVVIFTLGIALHRWFHFD